LVYLKFIGSCSTCLWGAYPTAFIKLKERLQRTHQCSINFFVSLILSFGISFYLESIIGITTFWLHSIDFLKDLESIANQVLTGRLIPLVFFPTALANFIAFTPFRYVVSFPIEILMHKATGTTLVFGFTLQFFWFVSMLLLYKYLYNKGVVKFQAYG